MKPVPQNRGDLEYRVLAWKETEPRKFGTRRIETALYQQFTHYRILYQKRHIRSHAIISTSCALQVKQTPKSKHFVQYITNFLLNFQTTHILKHCQILSD